MGCVFRNIGAAGNIFVDHCGIVNKGKVLHVNAQIAPVGRQDVLAAFRKLQRVKDLLRGIGAGPQHVRIFLLQDVGVGLSGGSRNVGNPIQDLLHQFEKFIHFRP